MHLAAVDPAAHGRKASAYALLHNGRLAACGYARTFEQIPLGAHAYQWVFEEPRKYRRFGKAHSDLDRLKRVIREWSRKAAARGDLCDNVYPHGWKGNVPKQVFRARMRAALTNEELDLLPPESQDDVWDAVGLALVASGRLLRGGALRPK